MGLKGASSPLFATATTAASGGYREELLGQRPAGCECRPRHEADAGCRNPSGPARRNRRALAALNTRHLLRKPVCGLKAPLGLSCPPGTAVLSGSLLVPKENKLRPAAAHRNRRALAALNTRHLLRKPVCGLKAPLGLSCPPGTAVLSGSLLSVKREHLRPVKHFPENPKLSLSVQKTFLSLHRSTQKVASCRIDTESLTKNIIFCILSLSALA